LVLEVFPENAVNLFKMEPPNIGPTLCSVKIDLARLKVGLVDRALTVFPTGHYREYPASVRFPLPRPV
jgi:hypothetical protein